MSKNVARFVGFAALVAIAGAASLSVIANDDGRAGQVSRWFSKLHGGHGGHGGHGSHGGHGHGAFHGVHHLVSDLDLTPDQEQRLDAIHETLMSSFQAMHAGHDAHLEGLIERIETGTLDADEAAQVLDQHLDELRRVLHTATGDVVALVNSLDADQRAVLLDHLGTLSRHHGD